MALVINSNIEYLSTKQASERLGLSIPTIRGMCNAGSLYAKKVGQKWLIISDKKPESDFARTFCK